MSARLFEWKTNFIFDLMQIAMKPHLVLDVANDIKLNGWFHSIVEVSVECHYFENEKVFALSSSE